MRNPNRKSFSMSPGSKSGFGKSSPRPASRPSPKPAFRPSVGVSRGPRESGPPKPAAGFQQPQRVYPGYRRPFYRRPGSIISCVVVLVMFLICVAVVAIVWIVPALLNGSFGF